MDKAVRVGYIVVDAAFEALKARVENELSEECRRRVLPIINEIGTEARSAAGIMVYLKPDRSGLSRLVLPVAIGVVGFLVGFILG